MPVTFVNFFLRSDSANRRILGCGVPGVGPMSPKFELGRYFCTMHQIAKFHHPTFNRSEVIVLTNKQTDAAETRQRAGADFPTGVARLPRAARNGVVCCCVLRAAYDLATAHAILRIVNGMTQRAVFRFFVPGDLDL